MEHDHLTRETLERLLDLDRTEDENRQLLHLIAVCPECRKAGGPSSRRRPGWMGLRRSWPGSWRGTWGGRGGRWGCGSIR